MLFDRNGIKLEVNSRKIAGKYQTGWRLNNTLLNSMWVKEDVSREIKIILNQEKENTTYQNVWDAAKAVCGRNLVALNASIRKERSKNQQSKLPS